MRILIVGLTALFLSGTALAAPAAHSGSHHASGAMSMQMPMMSMMMEHCAMMQRPEGTLAYLKTELAVTAHQSEVWDAFADAYRGQAKMQMKGGMMGGAMMGPSMEGKEHADAAEFPHVMSQHIEMLEMKLESAKKLDDAVMPLYEALSDEQRETANELLPHFLLGHCMM